MEKNRNRSYYKIIIIVFLCLLAVTARLLKPYRKEPVSSKERDFGGAQIPGMVFRNAHFKGSNMKGARMNGGKFFRSTFENCNLQNASLEGSDLSFTLFLHTDIRGASFENALMLGARFEDVLANSQTKLPFDRQEALARGIHFE